MNKLDLSILILSRSLKNLELLLPSVSSACGVLNYEVLIGWNGGEVPNVTSNSNVSVYDIRPYNFSINNNLLAAKANSDYLLFINDDMQLDAFSVFKALLCIKEKNDIGIIGANLRYPNENIQHAGLFLNDKNEPYHRYKNKVHFRDPRVCVSREVPAVTGAFILIKKNEFLALKFDERCKVAAQDVILCFEYRRVFQKKVFYCSESTAIHFENMTRKLFDEKTTPLEDVKLMSEAIELLTDQQKETPSYDGIKLRVITEKPGWIMYRKGIEICNRLKNARINEDYPEANIHYYINYGYFNKRPSSGIVVANFTHFDSSLHSDKWLTAAKEVDHCIAVSEEAAENIRKFGISDEKISVIKVGADIAFKPAMTLGVVGRVYPGGRKGEHLVQQLIEDLDVMDGLRIVSTNTDWGVPVVNYDDMADFYRSIDYLLVPALIEGGPVPFMEALACGTLSIAPPIGVISEFPHIEYSTGNYDSLRQVIQETKKFFLEGKYRVSSYMTPYNWSTWANQHIALFDKLLNKKAME